MKKIKEKSSFNPKVFTILLILFLALAGAAWGAEMGQGIVTGSVVNVRSIPSTSGEIITQVIKGDEVSVLGSQDDWYQVRTGSGKEGWIAGYLLQVQWVQEDVADQTSQPSMAGSDQVKIKLDNKLVDLDTPPYIDEQNRTMVPIRFVATGLGSQVFWNAEEKLVTITDVANKKIVQLWIGQAVAKISGSDVTLDTTPAIKDGRTMVPLRFVGDSLGVEVGWDGPSKTVVLTSIKPEPSEDTVPTDGEFARLALITGSVVNVRSGPGTEYDIVTQVKQGDALNVLGEEDQWYRVQTAEGHLGWIANWLAALRTETNSSSRSPEPGERERPDPPLYSGENYLLDISVNEEPDQVEIVITGEYPLNYSLTSLDNPRRLVVDFYNTTLDLGWSDSEQELTANQLASGIRVGQFTETQARAVIDLKKLVRPGVTISDDGTQLVLKLQPPSIQDKVIVIDAGHGSIQPGGWSDPGAIGSSGLYERDVVIDIAWKLYNILQEQGATVIMTRTGDSTNLDLVGRAQLANENQADIFVCIHANASTNSSVAGTSTYYYAPWDSALGAQRASRQRLAGLVQQELVSQLGRRDIGVLEANFVVLRETLMPSILVETAFISNAEEEKLLATEEFRTKAAEGIAQGIIRYFAEQ